jgi:hypothetical protein
MMHGYQLEARGLLEDEADMDSSQVNVYDGAVMFDEDADAEFLQGDEFDTETSPYPEISECLDDHYLQEEGTGSDHATSTSDRHEWLELSQASLVLDENGERIPFDELDDGDYSYQLVPL